MIKNLTPHKIAIVAQGLWIEILPEKNVCEGSCNRRRTRN